MMSDPSWRTKLNYRDRKPKTQPHRIDLHNHKKQRMKTGKKVFFFT